MRPRYLAGIIVIYLGAAVAWAILGASVYQRSEDSGSKLRTQVEGLWGTRLQQRAPTFVLQETTEARDGQGNLQTKTANHALTPEATDIKVSLRYDPRRKGLMWYRTYQVEFDATYTLKHDFTNKPVLWATFSYPAQGAASYDQFSFNVAGQEASMDGNTPQGLVKSVAMPPGRETQVKVHYRTNGMDTWGYIFGEGVTQVKNFKLVADTNFQRYDFPPEAISPTEKQETSSGAQLTWAYTSQLSSYHIGIEVPDKLQAGPTAARIAFFAPVGLLFFIAVIVIMGMMWGQNLHPMHYFFVGAGFFSFHLLMAYLADHLDFTLTFLICAAMSVVLVISYLIRAVGRRFALRVALPAQILFLVVFSYSFFFKGYTGLAITIASILTLAVLMQVTAKVDWGNRFDTTKAPLPPAPPPPAAARPEETPPSAHPRGE
ncbi:MAG TPA: inner membrane CreD family protein [Armatimonadota bacterium]|jgi:hypothetical protein